MPLSTLPFLRATRRPLALLACVLAALLPPAAGAAGEDAQLKKSAESLAQTRGRIEALDRELDQARGQRDDLELQIEASEKRLDELKTRLAAQRSATSQQAAALRRTRAERSALEHKLADQRALLGRQIRAAYLIGRRGGVRLLLQQQDTARMQRLLTDFDYLNRARTQAIGAIGVQQETLRGLEARQQQETAQLGAAQAEQERAVAELSAARAQRLAAVQKLKGRIAGSEAELAQLRAGERELATLISRLKDLLADAPSGFRGDQPLARQKGHLPWPLRGKLLARYGASKAGGKLKWSGIWIAAAEGAPVRAVASGRIAYVGRLQRYGLLAVVEHGDGYYTLYGHNAEVAKSAGETVRAGEVLGRAGSSGGHEESGLYFELRKGSQPVDPMEWLGR